MPPPLTAILAITLPLEQGRDIPGNEDGGNQGGRRHATSLHHFIECLTKLLDDFVNMLALGNEGRGYNRVVTCPFDMKSIPEHRLLHLTAAMSWGAIGRNFHTCHHADAADVGHQWVIFQRIDGVLEIAFQIGGIFEQTFALVDFLRGDTCSAGCRVS